MKKRTALITGSSRGIGLAIKNKLEDSGIRVIAPKRDELDLLSDVSIKEYLAHLNDPIDILINNAGINILSAVVDVTEENVRQTIQTNLLGPFELVRGIVPGMVERKYGRIVNISSIWSEITKPRRSTYSMSKAALNGLTRTVAVEMAEHNVLVNAIAPGYVNTELTRKNNNEQEIAKIKDTIPIKRLAEPGEIAEVVAFFASESNTYVTGQVIMVDGGYICQ
jgi:3-oxoacyl-[acyl-carrier protein] reductase